MYESDTATQTKCQIDPFIMSDDDLLKIFPLDDMEEPELDLPDWLQEPIEKKGNVKAKKAEKTKINLQSTFSSTTVSESEKATIAYCLRSSEKEQVCIGKQYDYIPRRTLLYDIVTRFKQHTDIPLVLPFFTTFQLFSSFLLQRNITIELAGHTVEPSLWITVLCESGAGKTFTSSELSKSMQRAIDMTDYDCNADDLIWSASGIVSTLEFMQQWSGIENEDDDKAKPTKNRRVMLIDEATDFFQRLRDEKSAVHDMYSRLLDAYSHSKIEYSSKSAGEITIDKPVISFLGLATPERYISKITSDDIEGGFIIDGYT